MVRLAIAMIVGVAPQFLVGPRWFPAAPSLSDCLEGASPPHVLVPLDRKTMLLKKSPSPTVRLTGYYCFTYIL